MPPTISAEEGCKLISEQIDKAKELVAKGSVTQIECERWEAETEDVLIEAFGRNEPTIRRVLLASGSPLSVGINISPHRLGQWLAGEVQAKLSQLEAALVTLSRRASRPPPASAAVPAKAAGRPVNVFHGPVGSVQVGDHNAATVSQQIGADFEQILRMVSDLRVLADRLSENDRAAAIEQIDDLTEELRGAKKPSRIRAALSTLGQLAPEAVDFGSKVVSLISAAEKAGIIKHFS